MIRPVDGTSAYVSNRGRERLLPVTVLRCRVTTVVVNWPLSETLLMFLERERTLFPLSPNAFVATDSSRRKLREYENALIVARDGRAVRIERIEIGGYWGASWGRKLVSVLHGVRAMHVHSKPIELTIDELKRVVMEYLQYDQQKADPYLALDDALPAVLAKIRAATSFADVFRAIALPAVDEALDVL